MQLIALKLNSLHSLLHYFGYLISKDSCCLIKSFPAEVFHHILPIQSFNLYDHSIIFERYQIVNLPDLIFRLRIGGKPILDIGYKDFLQRVGVSGIFHQVKVNNY